PWIQQAGATVFAPFPSDTEYFGNPNQAWMINFRVANLDRMIAQLRAKGIEVTLDPEIYPNGRCNLCISKILRDIDVRSPRKTGGMLLFQSPQKIGKVGALAHG